jgi:hypothetical protein
MWHLALGGCLLLVAWLTAGDPARAPRAEAELT